MAKEDCPFARRIIAFLLLALVTFLIVNPIWECCDHLDNLRHLGPHGVLLILLAVALAGISLLKSMRWLLVSLRSSIADLIVLVAVPRLVFASLPSPLALETGPPLRI
ncbi:MAG TPA: hypothetical protein VJS11_09510 [Acidobacteriaceae bacterium]|nr:hypothetical protein [Acidobacteriaceae bacterium]